MLRTFHSVEKILFLPTDDKLLINHTCLSLTIAKDGLRIQSLIA